MCLAGLLGACRDHPAGLREWRASDHSRQPGEPTGQQAAPPLDDDPQIAAQALWNVQCANCHGAEGHGNGPAVSPMMHPPDMSVAAWQQSRTDAQLAASIRSGKGMMPPFGAQVTATGIDALVRLARSQQAR